MVEVVIPAQRHEKEKEKIVTLGESIGVTAELGLWGRTRPRRFGENSSSMIRGKDEVLGGGGGFLWVGGVDVGVFGLEKGPMEEEGKLDRVGAV